MIRLKPDSDGSAGFEWTTGVGGPLNRVGGRHLVAFVRWAILVVLGSPHIEDAEEGAAHTATGEAT